MPRILLILALVAALAVMQPGVAVASATQPPHPAGCHHHTPALPSHAPVSFECCANGHHAAMPSALFRHAPAGIRFGATNHADDPFPVRAPAFVDRISVSSSPPGPAPLRI